MGLKLSEWTALLCFCAFGIQYSYQFVAEMREINQNCVRDLGFCINVIPPPPPRRRTQNRRRMRTNTRRGQRARRPSPKAVAQSHTRLPSSAKAAAGAAPAATNPTAAYPPPPQQNQFLDPFSMGGGFGGGFGGGMNAGMGGGAGMGGNLMGGMGGGMGQSANPMDSFFPFMFSLKRKKRQAAAAEPGEYVERPRIRRGQQMYSFLNMHCRKSEFDIGCRSTGGICCHPHL